MYNTVHCISSLSRWTRPELVRSTVVDHVSPQLCAVRTPSCLSVHLLIMTAATPLLPRRRQPQRSSCPVRGPLDRHGWPAGVATRSVPPSAVCTSSAERSQSGAGVADLETGHASSMGSTARGGYSSAAIGNTAEAYETRFGWRVDVEAALAYATPVLGAHSFSYYSTNRLDDRTAIFLLLVETKNGACAQLSNPSRSSESEDDRLRSLSRLSEFIR